MYQPPTDITPVSWAEYSARRWPDLTRGMVVTVHRPWSWRDPLWSLVAARIRAYSELIEGHEASEHHAMLYVGGGKFASQESTYKIIPGTDYLGCDLTFWEPCFPGGDCLPDSMLDRIVAEAMLHVNDEYGYLDIPALAVYGLTGWEWAKEMLSDPDRWICSEAVCRIVRRVLAHFGVPDDCLQTPQALADWMARAGWPHRTMRIAA